MAHGWLLAFSESAAPDIARSKAKFASACRHAEGGRPNSDANHRVNELDEEKPHSSEMHAIEWVEPAR